MAIKNELGDLEGVAKVEGDPVAKTIQVEWESPASEERIKATLREMNYPPA